MFRVAINGFGRIGRQVTKAILDTYPEDLQIMAINDLGDVGAFAHLFKYDTNYGRYDGEVEYQDGSLVINGNRITLCNERNPADLPWKDLGIDVVVESTGVFTDRDKAELHLAAGARKVIISAPAKGEDLTVCLGVNEDVYDAASHHVLSNASCTTNCLAPAAKVVSDTFGIKMGLMTTVHAYTGDQHILDLFHSDMRRARAAAMSIIPTTTGAAKAVSLVVPELQGKFDGMAMRVPTSTVSVVDFVAETERPGTTEELLAAFDEAAAGPMKGILAVNRDPLVSIDFKGDAHSSTVDAEFTAFYGNLVKVVTWYDNEWAYSKRVADLVNFLRLQGD
ncbi:MAG: type I glyceraldehyde-3-phosphate dehydrogenase [Caldilineaceae bacterium SB0664_bin_22]|nr:type I glyceraldehyde-3-phosphate dehydrogenase [Caldilineaceae bacterium SB0664_bin_22]